MTAPITPAQSAAYYEAKGLVLGEQADDCTCDLGNSTYACDACSLVLDEVEL